MTPSPAHRASPPRSRRRRAAGLIGLLTLVAVTIVGSATAAPTTDTTAVDFVSITPKQVWGSNSISPGVTESVVVIGGATTVPTNATTVRLAVTVKGTATGTIELFPAGNPPGAGHTITWSAGQTVTQTTNENVGLQNKVSVKNTSTKAAVVTVKITGYSTQVTAGDINSSGGSPGQVLTDVGAGATWQTPPNKAFRGAGSNTVPGGTFATVTSVTVPAGAYALTFSGEFENQSGAVNTAQCQLVSPGGQIMAQTRGTATGAFHSDSIALVGLGNTTGGAYSVRCRSLQSQPGVLFDGSLVAIQVGSASGAASSFRAPARTQ